MCLFLTPVNFFDKHDSYRTAGTMRSGTRSRRQGIVASSLSKHVSACCTMRYACERPHHSVKYKTFTIFLVIRTPHSLPPVESLISRNQLVSILVRALTFGSSNVPTVRHRVHACHVFLCFSRAHSFIDGKQIIPKINAIR